MNYGGEDH